MGSISEIHFTASFEAVGVGCPVTQSVFKCKAQIAGTHSGKNLHTVQWRTWRHGSRIFISKPDESHSKPRFRFVCKFPVRLKAKLFCMQPPRPFFAITNQSSGPPFSVHRRYPPAWCQCASDKIKSEIWGRKNPLQLYFRHLPRRGITQHYLHGGKLFQGDHK